MSRRALMLATRDLLRSGLGYADRECDLAFDGHPAPRCGKVFLAVHRGGRRNNARDSIDELYDLIVTITIRVNEPYDRLGTDLIEKAAQGLDDRADAVRAFIHMNYDIMNRANTELMRLAKNTSTQNVYGFAEPLGFQSDDKPDIKAGEWFHAQAGPVEVGIVQNLTFGGARRLQPIPLEQ